MKRYFYSAESAHGTESSHGFSNDTVVRVFESKKARDNYVKNSQNISCTAITRRQVTAQATNWDMTDNKEIKPRPFTIQFWGIVGLEEYTYQRKQPPVGMIGTVCVCDTETYDLVDRFY